MPSIESALVVGAGMAGLTLAVALKRAGIDCEIVEIREHLSEPGTGISLQGPALRALEAVGLADACIARGFGYSYFKACDAQGNVTGTVELPRLLGPDRPATVGIMRHWVHEVLAEELERLGVRVRLGTTVTSLGQAGGGVDVAFDDGSRVRYDLVVGADGANSTIRETIFGAQPQPRYTGQMNWRATVSRPPDVQGRHSYFGPTNKSGFNPISQSQMYIYALQNAPVRPRWPNEEFPGRLRDLLSEFGGALGRARDEIVSAEQIICRPTFSLIMPPPWHRGRVVLIGDAAHATTPQLASGASIAIEDAVVLARLLAAGGDIDAVLTDFTARRYERCRMVVENSELLGEWEKRPGSPADDTVNVVARSYRELAKPM